MLTEQQRHRLIDIARAATAKAFLTAPGGTAYGAAVLTVNGSWFSAGQYSSYNHVTNVHAEQAALICATMNDEPDVLALGLASTSQDAVVRPCGVCRQVLAEHAARTSRDFEILMAHRHNSSFDRARVSELLPWAWTPQSRLSTDRGQDYRYRASALRSGLQLQEHAPRVGDHVVLTDGCVALVWDAALEADAYLVKIKYTPPDSRGRRKLAHSFTEPIEYQGELQELGWCRATPFGAKAAVVGAADIVRIVPALSLNQVGADIPGPLLDLLGQAGIDRGALRVTGSRAVGLQIAGSDWDLVVPVTVEQLPRLRSLLFDALQRNDLALPALSGTWRLLDRLFPGGREAILAERRFIDTVESGGAKVALMYVPPDSSPPLLGVPYRSEGRGLFHGRVTAAAEAAYKRAHYTLETAEAGPIHVTCFHKAANLLRPGDVLAIRGWLLTGREQLQLIQLLPFPDNIVWLHTARSAT